MNFMGRSNKEIIDELRKPFEEETRHPAFKNKREEHVWILERRARHLQKRIRASGEKELTMDKKELQALRWALSEVDG